MKILNLTCGQHAWNVPLTDPATILIGNYPKKVERFDFPEVEKLGDLEIILPGPGVRLGLPYSHLGSPEIILHMNGKLTGGVHYSQENLYGTDELPLPPYIDTVEDFIELGDHGTIHGRGLRLDYRIQPDRTQSYVRSPLEIPLDAVVTVWMINRWNNQELIKPPVVSTETHVYEVGTRTLTREECLHLESLASCAITYHGAGMPLSDPDTIVALQETKKVIFQYMQGLKP